MLEVYMCIRKPWPYAAAIQVGSFGVVSKLRLNLFGGTSLNDQSMINSQRFNGWLMRVVGQNMAVDQDLHRSIFIQRIWEMMLTNSSSE